jgi:hypothetical protein
VKSVAVSEFVLDFDAVRWFLAGFVLVVALGGCVRVKPYQREYLARPHMENDRSAGEKRFEQHSRGSREGSDGGTGEAGGGCGCN